MYQFHCHIQHSHDASNLVIPDGLHNKRCTSEGDSDTSTCLEPTRSSVHVQMSQNEDDLEEVWAATVIQTAFRAFLVRSHIVCVNLLIHLLQLLASEILVRPKASLLYYRLSFIPSWIIKCCVWNCRNGQNKTLLLRNIEILEKITEEAINLYFLLKLCSL